MKVFRELVSGGSQWLWVLVLALVSLLLLGIALLPTVLEDAAEISGPLRAPAGLYVLSLVNLALMIATVVSLILERFERPAVVLFVGFRVATTAWEYEMGAHSEWYLIISVLLYLLVGGAVLVFLSGHIQRRDERRRTNGDKEP